MKLNKFLHIKFILLLIGISFIVNSNSHAQLNNWRYELPITVSNNSGSQLINYQVLMRLNTRVLVNAGYMKQNGGDIRFAAACGSGLLQYYLENYMYTDSTRIWVKIASLAPNSSAVIYLFMGNPAAVSASTTSIFEGPHSSTNYVSVEQTNTAPFTQRGFRFTANRNILVTHFGKRIPNETSRYITLFDFNTHAIISQLQVAAGNSGSYNYNLLSRPVWLSGGNQYVIQVYQGPGDKYYFGVSTQIGPYLTYHDMRYCNNCNQNTFPTSAYPDLHYGTPDFLYYVRQEPVNPEPTCIAGQVADTNTPAPPSNLTAVAGNQQATLQWRKNFEFDVNRYYIYRNTVNNPNTASQIGYNVHPDTTFNATGLINGTPYYFWVKAADRYCAVRTSGYSNVAVTSPLSIPNQEEIPREFALHQNYPNPFNPVTDIKFDIPSEAFVKLVIYDLLGREVTVLVNEIKKPGKFTAKWDAENIPSGVYIYQMSAGEYEKTMKMVLLK